MRGRWLIVLLTMIVATACFPNPSVPPTPTKTPDLSTDVPPTPLPTLTPTPEPTLTPTPEPTLTPTLVPTEEGVTATFPPPPTADASLPAERYCMIRPVGGGGRNFLDRTYPYGSTSGGQYLPHVGGDFPNPEGTPAIAVGNGTIIYAGSDAETVYGPQPNFYGNLVVMQVPACGGSVYALYGHLASVSVATGDQVSQGDVVGEIGGTGVAAGGSHLHFEVRVGNASDYFTSTRNPDLWIYPFGGYGTLAGRITDAGGNYVPNVTIRIDRRGSDDLARYAFTYESAENRPDDAWGENFTYGDLPEGWYRVSADSGRLSEEIYIRPGETSWVEFVLGG